MNPRAKQFALSGSLTAWSRLTDTSASAGQRRTLHRVYRGREPRVYSRYGVRQWSVALPATRLVVKDPFALLSLPLLVEVTSTRPVVLFRHPGAMLTSYRRMGWRPAVQEIAALLASSAESGEAGVPAPDADPVDTMAWFWSTCYATVLSDLVEVPDAVLVDHAELTRGGDRALRQLLSHCGVAAGRLREDPIATRPTAANRHKPIGEEKPVLHNFRRTADDIVESWRGSMSTHDAERIEELTRTTWTLLRERRMRLDRSDQGTDLPTGMETR